VDPVQPSNLRLITFLRRIIGLKEDADSVAASPLSAKRSDRRSFISRNPQQVHEQIRA